MEEQYKEENDIEYFIRNEDRLRKEYGDKWVIILDREVLAAVDSEEEIRPRAMQLGLAGRMYYAQYLGEMDRTRFTSLID